MFSGLPPPEKHSLIFLLWQQSSTFYKTRKNIFSGFMGSGFVLQQLNNSALLLLSGWDSELFERPTEYIIIKMYR